MEEWEERLEEEQQRRGYSESWLSAIKRRLNLQSLGAYLCGGSDKLVIRNDSFQDREATAFLKLEKWLTEAYGKQETNKIVPCLNEYIAVVQEIHFSLGMKAGATLHCKLTDNFETDI